MAGPGECAAASGDRSRFYASLREAGRRVAVLAEASGGGRQRESRPPDPGEDFDAVFDVGFVPQEEPRPLPRTPYGFVPDGPTEEERAHTSSSPIPDVAERTIPWVAVGLQTPTNASLAAELVEALDPGGFVSMPDPTMSVREPRSLPDLRELSGLLGRTGYYVWGSDGPHYESHCFVRAILNGAVPCRVGGGPEQTGGIPGSFESVSALRVAVDERGFDSMYGAAREFYLSRGTLGEHLENALESV